VRSRIEIDVDAPPGVVFALARDVVHWPMVLPHYRSVTVKSHDGGALVVTMSATRRFGRLGVPVAWRSRTWAEDADPNDVRLRFVHVGGFTRGMDVTWHITPRGAAGSHVAIEHAWRRRVPLLDDEFVPRLIDKLFVQPIATRTLATFKNLAEGAARP
jgi:ribosome-associated toxin RatA of RatAB toxin-antitoxin module